MKTCLRRDSTCLIYLFFYPCAPNQQCRDHWHAYQSSHSNASFRLNAVLTALSAVKLKFFSTLDEFNYKFQFFEEDYHHYLHAGGIRNVSTAHLFTHSQEHLFHGGAGWRRLKDNCSVTWINLPTLM